MLSQVLIDILLAAEAAHQVPDIHDPLFLLLLLAPLDPCSNEQSLGVCALHS